LRPWARNHDNHFKEQIMNKYPVMTAAAENPVGDNQSSFTASPRGVVNARSAAACGTFTVIRVS
jgi:hypothetical protein